MREPHQPSAKEGLLQSSGDVQAATFQGPPVVLQPRHSVSAGPERHSAAPAHHLVRPAGRPLVRLWLASFAVLFVAIAAWSFASPLGSGPDEPAHLVRAVSLVRGQLVGQDLPHPTTAQKSTVIVQVPEVFASLETHVGCFQYKSNVPAGCQRPLNGSTHTVSVETYVGRYPPLYYALVGLPTLVLVSAKGIYAARLVSGALSAAMLALAITSLRRCRGAPLLAAGVAVAITPMALYLAAVVSPSGLEIASAIQRVDGGHGGCFPTTGGPERLSGRRPRGLDFCAGFDPGPGPAWPCSSWPRWSAWAPPRRSLTCCVGATSRGGSPCAPWPVSFPWSGTC